MGYSKEAIYDALTCDSSAEGCDGDWRRHVLEKSDPKDVALIKGRLLFYYQRNTDGETETQLVWEGTLKRRPTHPRMSSHSMGWDDSREPRFSPPWHFDQNR